MYVINILFTIHNIAISLSHFHPHSNTDHPSPTDISSQEASNREWPPAPG